MKIAVTIVRILLGLVFTVFGLNGFLNFIPTGPLPTGLAGQFVTVLMQSHWVLAVSFVQLLGGVLLLVNRFVPLGLTFLGPVIVNILLYHFLLSSMGLPIALAVAIFWIFLFVHYRQYFSGLFVQQAS